MANWKDILTLGIFDYSKVVDLLAGSFKKSVNPTVTENQTNSLINILKPQNVDYEISVRTAQAWIKYWDCLQACLKGKSLTGNWLPGCYTEGSPYSPCQSDPRGVGGYLPIRKPAPKLPGKFPCCSACAQWLPQRRPELPFLAAETKSVGSENASDLVCGTLRGATTRRTRSS
jgi:hypothetical protein